MPRPLQPTRIVRQTAALLAVAAVALGACGRINYARVDGGAPPIDDRVAPGPDVTAPLDTPAPLDTLAPDIATPDAPPPMDVPAPTDVPVPMDDAPARDVVLVDNPPPPDAPACMVTSPGDYCAQLVHLPVPPVIDGVVDCGLHLRPVGPAAWSGPGGVPAGYHAEYAIAWHATGGYVFVHVISPTRLPAASSPLYCGEALEVFADNDGRFFSAPMYDNPGTSQLVLAAPANATDRTMRGEIYRNGTRVGAWSTTRVGVFPTADGFVAEMLIDGSDVGLPIGGGLSAGARVGFDIAVDVPAVSGGTGACARRLGQYVLRVRAGAGGTCAGYPACDTGAFCTPTLLP